MKPIQLGKAQGRYRTWAYLSGDGGPSRGTDVYQATHGDEYESDGKESTPEMVFLELPQLEQLYRAARKRWPDPSKWST